MTIDKTNERLRVPLRESCRLCDEPAEMQVLRTEPSVRYVGRAKSDQELTATWSYPSAVEQPQLCYYHKKMVEGYFDCRYPLNKYGSPQQQRTLLKIQLLKQLRLVQVGD